MHNPQRTTRAAVEASHCRYRASHIRARSHVELTADLSSESASGACRMPSAGRTNSAVASGVLMAMAHYACAYHRRYIPSALGEVPHKKTHAENAARACGAWLALACAAASSRARAHPCTMGKNQHSFNHNFPMRDIMYSCCHECIHVSVGRHWRPQASR